MPATTGSGTTPMHRSEARDQLLARVAFEAVWERDLDTDTLSWEKSIETIFGYRRDEITPNVDWWRERVHPGDLERVDQTVAEALRNGGPGWANEYRFRRKDDSWAWVCSRCAIERDTDGRARRAIGAMIDISRLKEAEARLRLFTEQIPARACATDRDLRVVWDAGAAFSDSPSVVGKTVAELFSRSPDRERVLEACRAVLSGESCSLDIDDGTSAAHLQLEPCRDPGGSVMGVVGVAFDITARVRTEEEVRRGRWLLRQVLDTLPVGVVVVDRAGDILLSNPAATAIWGGQIVGGAERRARSKGFWHATGEAIAPDEWASLRAVRDGEGSRDELIDIEAFDGKRKTIENYAAPLRDAKDAITGAVVVNEDVTERVSAEEGLRNAERELARRMRQLEALSRKLIAAQEAERRAVARELHDDFGQVLTALKLNLQRRERDDAESIALVDGAIARMRDLAQDLRPPLLDERGLEASLHWYVEREAGRAGLAFHVTAAALEPRPPVSVETTCFRIAQEALTNVIRHAHARVVNVELSEADGFLLLVVRDDGRGFDVAAARARAASGASQGLLSMQERAALAGGELAIVSATDRGTTIRAKLPLVARDRP